jgi:hypothetical protein
MGQAVTPTAINELDEQVREFLELCSAELLEYVGEFDPIRHNEFDRHDVSSFYPTI